MRKKIWLKIIPVLIIGILIGVFLNFNTNAQGDFKDMDIEEKRQHFLEEKETIIEEQIVQGDYACCLEKPCTYCIEKDPKHGEGATCNCLKDVMEGVHPCGECIGEIMEGHGNKFLAKYFATSIAEEMGEQHLETLKQMMYEKYGVPIEEQI